MVAQKLRFGILVALFPPIFREFPTGARVAKESTNSLSFIEVLVVQLLATFVLSVVTLNANAVNHPINIQVTERDGQTWTAEYDESTNREFLAFRLRTGSTEVLKRIRWTNVASISKSRPATHTPNLALYNNDAREYVRIWLFEPQPISENSRTGERPIR